MARPMFTPEELEELRRFDEELDEDFVQTQEEIVQSRKRDRAAAVANMEPKKRKIAERNAAYYEANKDKIAEYQAAYYEANKDKIAERNAAYREANRGKYNAYQREYRRKLRERRKAEKLANSLMPGGTPQGCALSDDLVTSSVTAHAVPPSPEGTA